ncbi:hypothetical protein L345_17793 [Ophiophagus hannah]|uniref:Uncharacterized protein n=1 Tax=Ophiophagus hannah TaxID=8665 RepID=V8N3R0_OPHHA|nr:hypothetical protein L345_17793 [Ophiophagus hannah]
MWQMGASISSPM